MSLVVRKASARPAYQRDVRVVRGKESLTTTSRVLTFAASAPAASADLIVGRDTSAVASWGDRFPIDLLAWNVPTLSRIKASRRSTAGRYMVLFKVVLCTWGKIVGEGLSVMISRATSGCKERLWIGWDNFK